MKTIFDKLTRDELIKRIEHLNKNSVAVWGKMNAYQMIKHCSLWDEMVLQNKKVKQVFMGRLFGKMVLKKELKEGSVMRRNSPTVSQLVVKETGGDYEIEKNKWLSLINLYQHYSLPDYSFIHPFFGKMTRDEIGFMAFKHIDHHLKQFNC